jgi:hypothetical protein
VSIVIIPHMTGIALNQTCPSKREYTRVGKFDDFRERVPVCVSPSSPGKSVMKTGDSRMKLKAC